MEEPNHKPLAFGSLATVGMSCTSIFLRVAVLEAELLFPGNTTPWRDPGAYSCPGELRVVLRCGFCSQRTGSQHSG